jgi:RHS repeat-associated protein
VETSFRVRVCEPRNTRPRPRPTRASCRRRARQQTPGPSHSRPDGVATVVFLNARYLDPVLGRFISVDPLVSSTRDAYGHGNNNPITFSDPLDLWPKLSTILKVTAVVVLVVVVTVATGGVGTTALGATLAASAGGAGARRWCGGSHPGWRLIDHLGHGRRAGNQLAAGCGQIHCWSYRRRYRWTRWDAGAGVRLTRAFNVRFTATKLVSNVAGGIATSAADSTFTQLTDTGRVDFRDVATSAMEGGIWGALTAAVSPNSGVLRPATAVGVVTIADQALDVSTMTSQWKSDPPLSTGSPVIDEPTNYFG